MNIDYDQLYAWISINPTYQSCQNLREIIIMAYKNNDVGAAKYLTQTYDIDCPIINIDRKKLLTDILENTSIDMFEFVITNWTDFDFKTVINTYENLLLLAGRDPQIIKYLIENHPDFLMDFINELFYYAHWQRKFDTLNYIYNIIIDRDIEIDYNYLNYEHLDQILWANSVGIDVNPANILLSINEACQYGELRDLQKIFELWPKIITINELHNIFETACMYNQIETASWLKHTFPQIDVKFNDHSCFRKVDTNNNSCQYNAISRRKWLLSFYENYELPVIINFIYEINIDTIVDTLIRHIAINFDIINFPIGSKYQSKFNSDVEKINYVFANTKSARYTKI